MTHLLMINGRQDTTRMMTHHQMTNGRHDAAAVAATTAADAVAVASFAKHEMLLFIHYLDII